MRTYSLTQMQMAQVLAAANEKCNEDGDFTIDVIFEKSDINVMIEGNMHICHDSYIPSDWYNEGYNYDEWETDRYGKITEAKVYTEDEEYDLDEDDLEVIDEYINDTENFN